ncbi:MAG: CCA tRNA nucleotidyltransferase [Cyanobacteria bacterium J06641_5]
MSPSGLMALADLHDWLFAWDKFLPLGTCLVGGAVRDALLGRQRDRPDLDFVVPMDAIAVARAIAQEYNAGFVVLDAKRQIARVVFAAGTADFALQEGKTLGRDLQRRDFTINAIAYDFNERQLQDPLGGCADLQRRCLRMVSRQNLLDDPLRLLRAYRQAAQLEFAIEAETRAVIQELAAAIANVAAERVQAELNYLLAEPVGSNWLAAAWTDGILSPWLPAARAAEVAAIDRAAAALSALRPAVDRRLQAAATEQALSWLGVAKLTCLVATAPKVAEQQVMDLKYSRAEARATAAMVEHLPTLLAVATIPMSSRQQYFFFQAVGDGFLGLAVLAHARGLALEALLPYLNRFLDPGDRAAHPRTLVSGKDLMQALALPPSPKIGTLLTEIQVAFAEGKVDDATEALAFAADWVRERAPSTPS